MATLDIKNAIVTCLIGDPVEHSISDVMFNYFAKRSGIKKYIHLKFRVSSERKSNLKIAIQSLRVFGIKGANITLPYKSEVVRYLDVIDKPARIMGAVNTIVHRNNQLIGYNTDEYGATHAIEKRLRKIRNTDRIVIFGAGGAARAISFGLLRKTSHITIINRILDFKRAKKLKQDFNRIGSDIKVLPLTDKNIIQSVTQANFVINATPVGMYPKPYESIIPEPLFRKINKYSSLKDKYFFDAVFNPVFTKFLLAPNKSFGTKVCPGLYMMIYQGIRAFKLWTGEGISEQAVRIVHNLLKRKIYETYGR